MSNFIRQALSQLGFGGKPTPPKVPLGDAPPRALSQMQSLVAQPNYQSKQLMQERIGELRSQAQRVEDPKRLESLREEIALLTELLTAPDGSMRTQGQVSASASAPRSVEAVDARLAEELRRAQQQLQSAPPAARAQAEQRVLEIERQIARQRVSPQASAGSGPTPGAPANIPVWEKAVKDMPVAEILSSLPPPQRSAVRNTANAAYDRAWQAANGPSLKSGTPEWSAAHQLASEQADSVTREMASLALARQWWSLHSGPNSNPILSTKAPDSPLGSKVSDAMGRQDAGQQAVNPRSPEGYLYTKLSEIMETAYDAKGRPTLRPTGPLDLGQIFADSDFVTAEPGTPEFTQQIASVSRDAVTGLARRYGDASDAMAMGPGAQRDIFGGTSEGPGSEGELLRLVLEGFTREKVDGLNAKPMPSRISEGRLPLGDQDDVIGLEGASARSDPALGASISPEGEVIRLTTPEIKTWAPEEVANPDGTMRTVMREVTIPSRTRPVYSQRQMRMKKVQVPGEGPEGIAGFLYPKDPQTAVVPETVDLPVDGARIVEFVRGPNTRLRRGPLGQVTADAADERIYVVRTPDGRTQIYDGQGGSPVDISGRDLRNEIVKLVDSGYQGTTAYVGSPHLPEDQLATASGAGIVGVTDVAGNVAPINDEALASRIRNLLGPPGRPADQSQPYIAVPPEEAAEVLSQLDRLERVNPARRREVLAAASNAPEGVDAGRSSEQIVDILKRIVSAGPGARVYGGDVSARPDRPPAPGVYFGADSLARGGQPAERLQKYIQALGARYSSIAVAEAAAELSPELKTLVMWHGVEGRPVQPTFEAALQAGDPAAFNAIRAVAEKLQADAGSSPDFAAFRQILSKANSEAESVARKTGNDPGLSRAASLSRLLSRKVDSKSLGYPDGFLKRTKESLETAYSESLAAIGLQLQKVEQTSPRLSPAAPRPAADADVALQNRLDFALTSRNRVQKELDFLASTNAQKLPDYYTRLADAERRLAEWTKKADDLQSQLVKGRPSRLIVPGSTYVDGSPGSSGSATFRGLQRAVEAALNLEDLQGVARRIARASDDAISLSERSLLEGLATGRAREIAETPAVDVSVEYVTDPSVTSTASPLRPQMTADDYLAMDSAQLSRQPAEVRDLVAEYRQEERANAKPGVLFVTPRGAPLGKISERMQQLRQALDEIDARAPRSPDWVDRSTVDPARTARRRMGLLTGLPTVIDSGPARRRMESASYGTREDGIRNTIQAAMDAESGFTPSFELVPLATRAAELFNLDDLPLGLRGTPEGRSATRISEQAVNRARSLQDQLDAVIAERIQAQKRLRDGSGGTAEEVSDLVQQETALTEQLRKVQNEITYGRSQGERSAISQGGVVGELASPADATTPAAQMRNDMLQDYLYGGKQDAAAGDSDMLDADQASLEEQVPRLSDRAANAVPAASIGDTLYQSMFGTRQTEATAFLELLDPDVPASQAFRHRTAVAGEEAAGRLQSQIDELNQIKEQVRQRGGINAVIRDIVSQYASGTSFDSRLGPGSTQIGNVVSDMARRYASARGSSQPQTVLPGPTPRRVDINDASNMSLVENELDRRILAIRENPGSVDVAAETDSVKALKNTLAAAEGAGAAPERVAVARQQLAVLQDLLQQEKAGRGGEALGRGAAENMLSQSRPPKRSRLPADSADNRFYRLSESGGPQVGAEYIIPVTGAEPTMQLLDAAVGGRVSRQAKRSISAVAERQQILDETIDRGINTTHKWKIDDARQRLNAPGATVEQKAIAQADLKRAEAALLSDPRNADAAAEIKRLDDLVASEPEFEAVQEGLDVSIADDGFGNRTLLFSQQARVPGSQRPPMTMSQGFGLAYAAPEGAPYISLRFGEDGTPEYQLVEPGARAQSEPQATGGEPPVRQTAPAEEPETDSATYPYEGTPFDYEDGPSSAASTRPRQADVAPSESTADRIRQAVDEASGEPGPAKAGEADPPPPDAGSGKPKRRIFNRKNAGRAAFMGAGAAMYGASQNEEIADRVRELLGENTAGNGLPSFMSSASAAEIGSISDTNNPEAVSPEEAALDRLSRPAGRVRPVRYFTYYNPLPR